VRSFFCSHATYCNFLFCAADVLLAQKLEEELQYEKDEHAEDVAEPEFLKTFNEQGIWQVFFFGYFSVDSYLIAYKTRSRT
jgi:hypothetical protein